MKPLLQLVIAVAIVPLAIYFWPAALGGDTEFVIVSGQSMHPTILDGSFVITKETSPYEVGDIVAFYSQENQVNIVHRIIELKDNGSFVIKGDNNQNPDPGSFTDGDIFGEVIFATPYVGMLLGLFRNPMFLLFSAIVLVTIQMIQKNRKEKKEKRRRILLGLPPLDPKQKNKQKKSSKPSYSIFYLALFLNVVALGMVQMGIANGVAPEGDIATGFFFNIFGPSFASILSFSIYLIFILVLFSATKKHHQKKPQKTNVHKSQNLQLYTKKKTELVPIVTQFLALMFVLMVIYHLITFAPKVLGAINS